MSASFSATARKLVKRLASGNLWRTGLMLASSAALGGIAVAVWNRKGLNALREGLRKQDDKNLTK